MSNSSVSVIIPIYNVVRFLEGAINSVFAQNHNDLEIIVVNDGSNAGACKQIAAICSSDNRIHLINQTNAGQAVARCNGIKHARSDYILFLDGDDILLPHAISTLVSCLDANPSYIASYGAKILMDEMGQVLFDRILPTQAMAVSGDILPALLQGVPLLSNGSICIRRTIAEQIIFPPNIRYGEDWITWCRLALLGNIMYAGNKPVLCVRRHSGNTSGEVFSRSSKLFEMLDFVFKDSIFINRIGKQTLAKYLAMHKHQLHGYLLLRYTERKQPVMVFKHNLLRKFWLQLYQWREAEKKITPTATEFAPKSDKIRVLHIVKYFYAGGAERLISALLEHSDKDKYEHIVLSLSDGTERIRDIQDTLNIPYKAIDIRRDKNNFIHYLKIVFFIKRVNPDIIKTWLPPANIAGGIIGKLLRIPVIWGIHDAQPPKAPDAIKQIHLSRFLPARIVCCSKPVYAMCLESGYTGKNLEIITNGTDTRLFSPRPEGRKRIRKELGISDGSILIGMAAECIPLKRHGNFLVAAKTFLESYPGAQFLFCGKDTTSDNPILKKFITVLGLEKHVHLLGIRNDMADIYSALDIHTLNSRCESFGLAITEAMACKTLCVATDVGVMKDLLKEVGEVIPVSEDPGILANAWKQLVNLTEEEKSERLEKGRQRIMQDYSITETAKQYDALYSSVYRTEELCLRDNHYNSQLISHKD